jgi:nitrogenase subunit NifH
MSVGALGLGGYNVIARSGVTGYGLPLMILGGAEVSGIVMQYMHTRNKNRLYEDFYEALRSKYANVPESKIVKAAEEKTEITLRLIALKERRSELIKKRSRL